MVTTSSEGQQVATGKSFKGNFWVSSFCFIGDCVVCGVFLQ